MTDYAAYQGHAQNERGDVVARAWVEVRDEDGGALATIYSGRTGGALGNPFQADSRGFFRFFVEGGAYKIRIYTGSSGAPDFEAEPFRYVAISTAAEHDFVSLGVVSIDQLGASPSNAAAVKTPLIQDALDTGLDIYVPPGLWPCNKLSILIGHTKLRGAGRSLSVLTTASTNTEMISIAADLDGVEISDLGFTRSSTAVAGGVGINCVGYLDADFRRLEIQKQYVGAALLSSGHGLIYDCYFHDNIVDHVEMTNTAANGTVQWKGFFNNFEKAGSRGVLLYSSAGPAQVTAGNWAFNDFFANGSFGFAAIGLVGVPINGLRIVGGVNGENGNSSIYLDTYGGKHSIDSVYTELSGTRTTGPGFATAASHVGCGIEITAHNTNLSIDSGDYDGHSDHGIITAATVMTTIGGTPSIVNNSGTGLVIADGTKAQLAGAGYFANNGGSGNLVVTLNASSLISEGNTPDSLNRIYPVSRGGTGASSASGTALDNITGFSSTGHLVRTASATYAFRTITGPAAGVAWSNGSGVSGNPTLSLANDLAAIEALTTNGFPRRTATDTWTIDTPGQMLGEPSNGNASAGNVGEYLESVIASGSAVAVATTNTPQNITGMSITLTAGDWDIDAQIVIYDSATTVLHNYDTVSISTTSATLDVTNGRFASRYGAGANIQNNVLPAAGGVTLSIPPHRRSVNGSTQLFGAIQCGWSGAGTPTAFGILRARRVR